MGNDYRLCHIAMYPIRGVACCPSPAAAMERERERRHADIWRPVTATLPSRPHAITSHSQLVQGSYSAPVNRMPHPNSIQPRDPMVLPPLPMNTAFLLMIESFHMPKNYNSPHVVSRIAELALVIASTTRVPRRQPFKIASSVHSPMIVSPLWEDNPHRVFNAPAERIVSSRSPWLWKASASGNNRMSIYRVRANTPPSEYAFLCSCASASSPELHRDLTEQSILFYAKDKWSQRSHIGARRCHRPQIPGFFMCITTSEEPK